MKLKLTAGWFYGAAVIVLSAWILHSFFEAILGACVTAIASWPLYRRFARGLSDMGTSELPVGENGFLNASTWLRSGAIAPPISPHCAESV